MFSKYSFLFPIYHALDQTSIHNRVDKHQVKLEKPTLTANGHMFTVQSRIGLSYHRPLIRGVPPMTQNPYLTTHRAINAETHGEGPLSDLVLPHSCSSRPHLWHGRERQEG
ncbi:hypothetical protein NPIL_375771 [Nephila pilipes]|uniref:Uncharacterized protein n=1 Tax=Nephila pilipes TaxID=299642 RepID=A0A8X6MVI5_NEPPI|nr:hypothetical protein NPIL_375771 [Nephila pilipes]